jgi:site-specific DNA-methyltransferase (adenine-specific)
LERIIKLSSNERDLILDAFCGCGTTTIAAERLNRRWIGIDITHLAISHMQHRLQSSFGHDLSPYEVLGVPKDVESARALAQKVDRHHFEWWAVGLVGARPAQDKKKGADSGVDGVRFFDDDKSGISKKVVVQVKSGHVKAGDIRDFAHVIERERAALGLFITLEEPSAPMKAEAAGVGFYEPKHWEGQDHRFPKLQILTIEAILQGHRPDLPAFAPSATFKQAPRKMKETNPKSTLWDGQKP